MSIARKLLMGASAAVATGPQFIGANSASDSSSLSFEGISDLQEGDLVFCNFVNGATDFSLSSSGWTVAAGNAAPSSTQNNGIRNLNCYKFMGATPDASIGLNRAVAGLTAAVFRGVGTPVVNGFQVTSGSEFFSGTTVTIANDGCVYLIGPLIDDDNSTISSVPSGFTVAAEAGFSGASTRNSSVAIIYKIGVPSGDLTGINGSWSSDDDLATRGFELPPT